MITGSPWLVTTKREEFQQVFMPSLEDALMVSFSLTTVGVYHVNTMQAPNTESAIWSRLFRPSAKTLTAEAARSVLRLDFTPEDKDRMRELTAKAREGTLTASEKGEIKNYEHVGNVLAVWKSKARQRLKKISTANGVHH